MSFDYDLLLGLPFLLAMPVGWYFFWPRRCPACGGKVRTRFDPMGSTTKVRILADCTKCGVVWDTGMKSDTKYDD